MTHCAFLSTDHLEGFTFDDDLCKPHLEALGWKVEELPWRQAERASDFDLVVVRTPWDYQDHAEEFLDALDRIDQLTLLENCLEMQRWNLDKRYLKELREAGMDIVPTRWGDGVPDAATLQTNCDALGGKRWVIKPVVSANADYTWPFSDPAELTAEQLAIFAERPWMLQPFVDAVETEGEFSLFYFDGDYSHTILKRPKAGDFRVQEEHGGEILAVEAEAELIEAGAQVMHFLDQRFEEGAHPAALYARPDYVRMPDGRLVLMELELIEPALYLRMDEAAPKRFAKALQRRMRRHQGVPG